MREDVQLAHSEIRDVVGETQFEQHKPSFLTTLYHQIASLCLSDSGSSDFIRRKCLPMHHVASAALIELITHASMAHT